MLKDLDLETSKNKKFVLAVYVLQALFFIGLVFTPVMGVVINYIKQDDVQGSWLESHFSWQKNTFWYGLLWSTIALISFPVIGWVVALVASIWYFYRIAKGWIYLVDGKQMYL
ncbi:MAG: hypothetical protein H8E21_12715 [Gammaproteobacteria bacterium]|nr:hypothetical protein [Gammaproteobacteria bacterium]MBL6999855.1 hypothetical protein [Gammaproteobacteria bacterium]